MPYRVTAIAVALVTVAVASAKPPPPAPRTMPGNVKGTIETRWLAPYVSVTRRSVGNGGSTTVQWLDRDGKLLRELTGPNVDAQLGYVMVYAKGAGTIHAVNGSWQFALPAKGGPAGFITATEDSRTFLHQFHPKEGEIAIDVYIAGKRVNTIGPFAQCRSHGVELGPDGSFACLIWSDDGTKKEQVMVAGPDGRQRFRVDCDAPAISPLPAPDGKGVLVRKNDGGRTLACYSAAGKTASLDLGPNPGLLIWLPGTLKAVMHTSVGSTYRFHLIDWATGKRLWDIDDPLPMRVAGALPGVAAIADRLVFAGRDRMQIGEADEPVRSLCALDVKTGQVAARWLPRPLRPARSDGRLLRLGEDLYLVTEDEFSLIDVSDIAEKVNGWQ